MLEEDMEHPVLPKWLENSVIEHNKRRGLYLINSSSVIDNVEFLDNPACCSDSTCHNQYGGYGLDIREGSPTIKNSLFKNSIAGISINDLADPTIENNIFEENEKAINLYRGSPTFSNNQAINNTINGVYVLDHIMQDTTWQADLEYIVDGNISIFEDIIFTMNPGTIVKFYDKYSGISVAGTLRANNVLFTSFKDEPYPGAWDKIEFTPTSINSELNNIILQYAGGGYGTPCSPEMAY